MKKLFMSFMAMLLSGVMFMPAVFAEESFGTVTDITGDDTVHGGSKPTATITPNGGNAKDVTITYTNVNLKKVAAGEGNGRPEGYAWLGFKITKPSEQSDTNSAKVRQTFTGYSSSAWDKIEDDGMYYAGIDEDTLKAMVENDQNVFVVYEFDWNGDEKAEQTVTIVINPAEVTLYGEDDETALWNEAIYQEVLDSLTPEEPTIDTNTNDNTNTSTNNTSNVTVNKKANLDDVPKTGVVYKLINYLA